MELSHYQTLGLTHTCSFHDVREAYIKLKSSYQNSQEAYYSLLDAEDVAFTLEKLDEAFRVLRDPKSRERYDALLRHQGIEPNKGAPMRQGAMAHPDMEIPSLPKHTTVRKVAKGLTDEVMREIGAIYSAEKALGDGATLTKMRLAAQLNWSEIHEHTKVSLTHLQMLEENQFAQLPQIVYIKGFVRNYLEFLGINKKSIPLSQNPDPRDDFLNAYTTRWHEWKSQKHKLS